MRKIFLRQDDFFPNRSARLAITRELRQCPMPQHQHEFQELVIILSGEGIHNHDGSRYRISAGEILFIDENSFHGYEEPFRLNLINIMINPEALARMDRDLKRLSGYHDFFKTAQDQGRPHLQLEPSDLDQVANWIDHIEEEITGIDPEAGYIVAEAYLTILLSLLLKRFQHQSPFKISSDNFKNTIHWIDAHLDKPISVPLLAKRAGLSERSFFRLFKSKTGISPINYINQARLRKASALLKRSHQPLNCEEVARKCGFSDPGYFSTCFRKEFGKSPTLYRNELTKNVPVKPTV